MEKIIELENTGIIDEHINGGRSQEVLFKLGVHRFKISILSESINHQSYATLYKWTDTKGFSNVMTKNPKKDYSIDLSYRDSYDANAFLPIINDLKKLAKKFI